MSEEKNERIPDYIPWNVRLGLKLRKMIRQFQHRQAMKKAAEGKGQLPSPDGPWKPDMASATREDDVNKSSLYLEEDMKKPGVRETAEEIVQLKEKLNSAGLRYTNTAGGFIKRMYWPHSEKNKLWENAWTFAHSQMKSGLRVLDIGGASTVFSFYLASKRNAVTVVDNDWNNCGTLYNSRYVTRKMGWDLTTLDCDITRGLPFDDASFDRIFCICVLEHLTTPARMTLMKEIGRILRPEGIAAFTIDYTNSFESPLTDKGLRFGYLQKFQSEILTPSGLTLMGNQDLPDTLPENDFLGAFFLIKALPGPEVRRHPR